MSKIEEISAAVAAGKGKIVASLVEEALAEGLNPDSILNQGMINAMDIVGQQFTNGEIFVPEMLVAARAMKKGLEILKPSLVKNNAGPTEKFIIGTVTGDLHDIGKNLVATMMESAGFEVIDLGIDIPAEKFVEAVKNNPDCRIIGISALLTTTMPAMNDVISALVNSGLREQIKIIVGGAPVTQEYADKIGADGFAMDAAGASKAAKKLIS